jgi:hypothetical protein
MLRPLADRLADVPTRTGTTQELPTDARPTGYAIADGG